MGLLLLLLSVAVAQIAFKFIDGLPHLSEVLLIPFKWALLFGVVALLTWASRE